ncbi:MAG: hypothetical protein K6G75_05110 [Lachnospiraceae bacterium]|nr:hypothetical protein [Lachnospiraceae bacterium]
MDGMNENVNVSQASTLKETDKKCPQCGGVMDFDPNIGGMACPYCGYEEEIVQDAAGSAAELDFESAEKTENCNWGTEKKQIICKSCGAETIYDALDVASECPYCGSNQVMEANDENTLAPGGVVPFAITNEQASANFKQWMGKKFFCPKQAKLSAQPDAFTGIYLPYWTFDSETFSRYSGKYGIDRKEEYKDSNGNVQTKTVTDWHRTSGTFKLSIDDELVLGTERHDSAMLKGLEPFETAKNVPYKPEYVAGFAAERYSVGLKEAWEKAKNSISGKIKSKITNKIITENHADHAKDVKINTTYNQITYKYLMLPIWCSSFKYKDKIYQFMVNGQTGKVYGKTPVSVGKIILVIAIVVIVLAIICCGVTGINAISDFISQFSS